MKENKGKKKNVIAQKKYTQILKEERERRNMYKQKEERKDKVIAPIRYKRNKERDRR